MTVKVTFEFPTAAHAAAFLEVCDPENIPESPAAAEAGTKRRGRPPKAAQEAAAPTASAQAAATPAQTSPAAAPAQPVAAAASGSLASAAPAAVPFKDVADAITSLAEMNRDTAVALLAKFGASRANELKPEQYAAFVAEAKKALAPAPTQSLI